jgi:hypothetical protein
MDGHKNWHQEERDFVVESAEGQQAQVRNEPIHEQAVEAGGEEEHHAEVVEIIIVQGGDQDDRQKKLGQDGKFRPDEQGPPSADRLEGQDHGDKLGEEKAFQVTQ